MKNLFLSLLLLGLGCKSTTSKLRPDSVFKNAQGVEPPQMEVKNILEFLTSDDLAGREAGKPGIEKAANYIEKIFEENDIKTYFKSYKDTLTNFDPAAFNIVGYLEGNDPVLKEEFVIVGAHYDHIGTAEANADGDVIANGANDNATGTTAVIELAKHFGYTKSNKRSMLFVLFSAEEKGLLGSHHLARKLKKDSINLYTMVNFEMIGVPMATEHEAYITGYEQSNMAQKINEYAGEELIGFLPQAKEYNLFKRSDNYPFFLEFGIPAQTISTFDFTNYSYYHHVDDEASQMNIDHMTDFISDMKPVLKNIVNSPEREIKMNE